MAKFKVGDYCLLRGRQRVWMVENVHPAKSAGNQYYDLGCTSNGTSHRMTNERDMTSCPPPAPLPIPQPRPTVAQYQQSQPSPRSSTVAWQVGDTACCRGAKVNILEIANDYLGGCIYKVRGGSALDAWATENELKAYRGNSSEPKVISKANGCECGAHASNWPDDHMHFCPKFQKI